MNDDDNEDLFIKLGPCFNTKIKELNREGIDYIKKEDIWNYLKTNKWKDEYPYLSDMVADILNLDNYVLKGYVDNYIKERDVDKEE